MKKPKTLADVFMAEEASKTKDSLGRARHPRQDAVINAINAKRKIAGQRPTKAMRFNLPVDQADRLESMTKEERDRLLINALTE